MRRLTEDEVELIASAPCLTEADLEHHADCECDECGGRGQVARADDRYWRSARM